MATSGGTLKLAIVGCGAMADWHLDALPAARRTTVVACIDTDRDRADLLARRTGGVAGTTLDDALAAGADAVALVVPHDTHEALALAALSCGLHVVLEKPMATMLDACDRILAAARCSDRVFMVAENAQYWPEVVAAKEAIDAGAIGRVLTARSWHHWPPPSTFYAGERPWRFRQEVMGGGVAIDTAPHWLRPLRMVLGEIDEVMAVTERTWPEMDGESLVRSLCRFRSGVVASLDVILALGATAPMPFFQFTGSTGEMLITAGGDAVLFDGTDPDGTVVAHGGFMQSYRGVWTDFEEAVLDGRPLAASAEHSLGEVRAAHAIVRSAASRQWEPVW